MQSEALVNNLEELRADLSVISDAGSAFGIVDLLMDQLPELCAVWNSKGWMDVSRSLAEQLGWDRESLLQQPVERMLHPDDLERMESARRRPMKHATRTVVARYRMNTMGAGVRWLILRWTWRKAGPTGYTLGFAERLGEEPG